LSSANSAPSGPTRHIVLDITSFASSHPGGDLILLASGKDATVLFNSYHPRGVPPSLIKKLTIGTMEPNSFNSFYSWHSEFYTVLKQRVIQRLETHKLNRRGSIEIWIKAILLLVGFWYSLYKMYTTSTFLPAASWSFSMGIFAALIGTNIQHDGNHGAFARSKLMNKLAGWTMDMIGASAYTWEIQHMLGHHPYTNVLDMVEEEKKERNVDCKIEEKDQVCAECRECDRCFVDVLTLHRVELLGRDLELNLPRLFLSFHRSPIPTSSPPFHSCACIPATTRLGTNDINTFMPPSFLVP
jgi:hypothetical protein